jgi:primosomal protein N' (replication factor Y)
VNTPVSHLEGIYDYLVPEHIESSAIVGTRVIVEFGSTSVEGLIVDVRQRDEKTNKLKTIQKINSLSGLVSLDSINYLEGVRNRFGGSMWNLINQALPPRVIKEEALQQSPAIDLKGNFSEKQFSNFFNKSDSEKLRENSRVKWAINLSSQETLTKLISSIIALKLKTTQTLIIAPDGKDLNSLRDYLFSNFESQVVELGSHLPKNIRYRNFLRVASGENLVVVATRSGALVPLKRNATVILLSDLDQSHYEIHSPGWNSRDVTLLRPNDTSLIFISPSHSLEIERLIHIGWIERKILDVPGKKRIFPSDSGVSYLNVLRNGLKTGSVLVSVAEKGYSNLFLCGKCKNPANCPCGGKLGIASKNSKPNCYLCGKEFSAWTCNYCKFSQPDVISKGIEKRFEEIGRALPRTSILISSGSKQLIGLPKQNSLVLATVGSEPIGVYSALVLLDGEKLFNRPFLRSEELTRHHWFKNLISLTENSEVFVSLISTHPLVQSILSGKSYYAIDASLKERERAQLPPFFRILLVDGIKSNISKFSENLRSMHDFIVNGPVEIDATTSRLIIRCPLEDSQRLVGLIDDVTKLQGLKGKNIFRFRFDPFDF